MTKVSKSSVRAKYIFAFFSNKKILLLKLIRVDLTDPKNMCRKTNVDCG